jgi:F-type H+-transporting ATPase subunit epsilon
MATTIRVEVVSAEAAIYSGEATMVVATGDQGELGITPRHAPLITRLKPGKVIVTQPNGEKVDISILGGGILEVQPQTVTVLADTAIRSEDIDESAALAAKKAAEDALANRNDAMEVAEAQARLAAALTQLQALERLRRNVRH